MQLSVSNIAWGEADETAVGELLPACGFSAVDIAYTRYWPAPQAADAAARQALRARQAAAGLTIHGMQSLVYGRPELRLFGADEARAGLLQHLIAVFALAADLGAGPLVFGSPQNRTRGTLPFAAARVQALAFFHELAEQAVQHGVTLCLEPNPAIYGCDFLQTLDEAGSLVAEINHPGLRLTVDSGIMTINAEPIEAGIERWFAWIGHVHISEPQLAPIGGGAVDHTRFARTLRRLGWTGTPAVEMRAQPDSRNNLIVLREALLRTREVYHD
jgi:D-psicose/D-tagatose/L-ribulose 3-epimerase